MSLMPDRIGHGPAGGTFEPRQGPGAGAIIAPPRAAQRTPLRPDKQKVIDEVWDDQRVAEFLDKPPMGAEGPDYSVLLNAYRSMRPEDFQRFMDRFVAAGRDPAATSRAGLTLRQTIAGHRQAEPFVGILEAAGG